MARRADMEAGELAQLLVAIATLVQLLTQLIKVLKRRERAEASLLDMED